ncbi:MAG: TraB/GumN family protein, partial [Paenirhodobacter sp.]
MRRFILPLVVSLLTAAPLAAECVGTDLFAALPEAERSAITASAHAAPFAQGLIFRATKEGQEITLAGTFHRPDARHQALVDELTPVLEKASELLVEAGPEEEAKIKSVTTENP